MARILVYLFMVCIICVSMDVVADPVLRDGFPVDLPNEYPIHPQDILVVQEYADFGWLIAASSPGMVTLVDLNGNALPGWPKSYPYQGDGSLSPFRGPRLGDIEGDGLPELAVVYQIIPGERELKVFRMDGTEVEELNERSILNRDRYGIPLNCPVFADLDGDGDDELLYSSDSVYAYQHDGTPFEGFPWPAAEDTMTVLAGVVALTGEFFSDSPVILWATKTLLHARRIGDLEELPGWPVEVFAEDEETDYFYSPITIVPDEEGWKAFVFENGILKGWDQDGRILNGFPLPQYSQALHLAVGDLYNTGELDLIWQTIRGYRRSFTIQGELNPHYALNLDGLLSTCPVCLVKRVGADTLDAVFATTRFFENQLNAIGYEEQISGFPIVETFEEWSRPGSTTALIPTDSDTLRVVYVSGNWALYVYDLPDYGIVERIDWQMSGGTPGGNRVWSPQVFVDVPEGERSAKASLPDQPVGPLYPNPSNGVFSMPLRGAGGEVMVRVYNLLGQEVNRQSFTLARGQQVRWSWDGRAQGNRPLASGIYLVRVFDGEQTFTRRALLLR